MCMMAVACGSNTILLISLLFTSFISVIGDSITYKDTQEFIFNVSNYVVKLEFHANQTDRVVEGETFSANFDSSVTLYNPHVDNNETLILDFRIKHPKIAKFVGSSLIQLQGSSQKSHNLTVEGIFLGRTWFEISYGILGKGHTLNNIEITNNHSSQGLAWKDAEFRYHFSVLRRMRVIDSIFIVVVTIVVLIANIGMGCKIDLEVVKEVLKKPFAPAIGFACQFVIMPLVAFALVELLKMHGGQALGFFAAGCAPGGGASNIYTYLLEGDISLSITMTLLSTIGSLGMIPLWLFTLGRVIMDQSHHQVRIPYSHIIISLISILLPVAFGILLQKKAPVCAKRLTKIIRPFSLIFIIFMFTFGVYTNLYMFKLFTPPMILAGCVLPYSGFFLGGVIAFFCKQPWTRVKTIAIETGIQNTGIPIILMKFSLPQPDADLAMVSPVVVATFTPIPLLFGVAYYEIRKRCCKKKPVHDLVRYDDDEDLEMSNGDTVRDDARLHLGKNNELINRNSKQQKMENGTHV